MRWRDKIVGFVVVVSLVLFVVFCASMDSAPWKQ